jgi:hypothetical protein
MNNQAKIIIVSLLLVNIVLLITLFLGNPNANLRPQPKELIIKKLGFKEAQVSDYEGVVEEHSKEVHALQNEIRNYKQEINMGLLQENPVMNDSLNDLLLQSFERMEVLHFNHLSDIKEICNPEQKITFNQMVPELGKIFGPRQLNKKNRRKNKN